jgi:branched-subunit amino acid aminotransferase/4-amino-4-deoxychorismate lyase
MAYLKGKIVPLSECKLAIYDTGIVLGAAVTDFLRTFHLTPYRMEDHVRRFYESCKYARLKPPVPFEESLEISRKVISENAKVWPGAELGLVYYLTAGENPLYAGSAGLPREMQPTYVQHAFPLKFSLWKNYFTDGIHCVTPAVRHWPPQCLSSKIKNRNRLHMWIGDQEIHLSDPKAVGLYLDLDGNITETGGSNFVIWRGGKVISPRRRNILWGISLTALTEILAQMKIPFVEEDLQTFDAINAEEAWLPTTPYCLGPVVKVNGVPIGDGKPGKMWRKILSRWSKIVGKDVYAEVAEARDV